MSTVPIEELHAVRDLALKAVSEANADGELEEVSRTYLGKKGQIRKHMRVLGQLSPEERPAFGKAVNDVSTEVEDALETRRKELHAIRRAAALTDPHFDPTLPGTRPASGTVHPLTLVDWRLDEIFRSMGFYVLDYPEIDTEYFNFEALNVPADHPARDMQDTFWINDEHLLRTHTSAGQVRAMKEFKPPFKAIFPGRVFRYEATDASHDHTFHQVEGLYVDREVSVANLIASMKTLLSEIFGREVEIRLRPGYFPFVEPGFELDISCLVCGGGGCSVCKQSGWVELLPCGLVHPNVLRAGGLDPTAWQGWAFGLGLSRLVMMRYQIDDIRHLLSGDIRFLRQFEGTGLE
ncbi:MAG: phenylalanine--tRNA ligase subunit alpha [Myxococcales bacterium]|nr:phenylalanine--tRNA ligase subunit alpha [Myxococcales bacterium]